jgi:hypothetical protein
LDGTSAADILDSEHKPDAKPPKSSKPAKSTRSKSKKTSSADQDPAPEATVGKPSPAGEVPAPVISPAS